MEVEQVIANLEKRVESEKRGDRDSGGNHNSVQYCTNLEIDQLFGQPAKTCKTYFS